MANTSKRGFASMDAAKQREIASKGGRAAHAKGTAHEFTSEEARVAGRKGGEAVSRDRTHMSTIGREGGHSRGARARAAAGSGGASGNTGGDASRSESFERQVTSERSAFEPSGRGIERASDRGGYSSPAGGNSGNSRSSNERSGEDSSRDRGSFGGRGQL
jgi:general stress protein YciG